LSFPLSSKVVGLLGNDNIPIGVVMNYAMHPINFYLSGVGSADLPGEASPPAGFNPQRTSSGRQAIPAENVEAYP
jgi:hypothetical protein